MVTHNSSGFNGLNMSLSNLSLLSDARSRSISAENPNGEPGKGGMGTTGFAERQASELGEGWKVNPAINIKPGETAVIADVKDMGNIQSMWITGMVSRELIIRIYWDNQEHPSVEVPFPDFFAYGWCDNIDELVGGSFQPLVSLPVSVLPKNAFNCFWSMPFRERCYMTIENIGDQERCLYYQINYQLTDIPENCAYFHASFRRTNPVPFKGVHTIIDGIEGEGHYIGTAMCVGLNGAGGWWGEGEVKFYIDEDDEFPTICGTGTEDYFLGAFNWEVDDKYAAYNSPYGGMAQVIEPDGLYRSQPRFSMYRWHIQDPIRFKSKLKVTVQDLGWKNFNAKKFDHVPDRKYLPRQDDIATVSFWYQTLPTAKLKPLPDWDGLQTH
ncbi:glycoside hydrolase family 172 protein [Salinisphaera sp. G21_0]|uniref:glycoside hydrolase family 172 protein n=1 Tax=Salinisphaera sp. G21_0 TaxID=2821094 RepID=UPI0025704A71|nr:glycoside hydrolase family 172 protein [Salinisphaera sp. G21_0]